MTAQSLFARLPLAEQKRRLEWMEAQRELAEAKAVLEDAARHVVGDVSTRGLAKPSALVALHAAIARIDAARARIAVLGGSDGA